jgi:subtilisin family serine protease
VNYGENTHPHWDGVAVEANESGGYRFLLQGKNNLSGKAYVWTTNSQGVITGGSGWKSGEALSDLEEEFDIDLNVITPPAYVPDEILVKLKSEPTVTQTQSMIKSYGALAIRNLVQPDPNINSPVERWQILKFEPGSDVEEWQELLNNDSRVEVAEVNHKISINFLPNDPSFGSLWGLNNTGSNGGKRDADIDAPEAWDTQKGNKDVVVAVIDTGVDYNHPDLASNMWKNAGEIPGNLVDDDRNGHIDDVYGFDWVNEDGDPMDDESHGTHVAGTIGAVGNNNRGVVGVSPNVSIMSLKFLGSNGRGNSADAAQAIIYAANMGADIINASYGGPRSSKLQRDAIDYASQKGVLFVAAAGNETKNNDGFSNYPSNYNLPNVIAIAATDDNDKLARFSNYGHKTVDLGAPGVSILSTIPNNRYGSKSGTSMASPHVAGAAALVLAENPNLSVTELKKTLLDNTDSITSLQGKTVTGGRLNVNKAIQAVKNSEPEVNITSPTSTTSIEPGESHNIRWTDNFNDNVKLELYKGSSFQQTISSSTPSDGSYSWMVPTSLSSGTNYNVKIRNVNDSSVYDYSSYFTIEPEANITSPTSTTDIEPGETYTIGWTDNFSDNVKLELYKGSDFEQIISSSTSSDGSYSWWVPTSLSSGTNYNIKIRNVNDSSVYDYSSYFTIEPEVNITSPTSNTSIEPGESYTIRWTDNFSDNVRLELHKGSSFPQIISSSTSSDGSYSWWVPTSLSSGTNYRIKIRNVNDSSVYDYSSYFTIEPGESHNEETWPPNVTKDLNNYTGRKEYSGYVGSDDYYKFYVDSPGYLQFALRGMSADADLELLNSSGQDLESSEEPGNNDEYANKNLGIGTYYMRVYGHHGAETNYRLILNLDKAGDRINNARPLGELAGQRKEYEDFIGTQSADQYDYYKFTLREPRFLEYALRDLTASADIDILNSSGARITPKENDKDNHPYDLHETMGLQAGTYYARVTAPTDSSEQTNYKLVLNLKGEYEPDIEPIIEPPVDERLKWQGWVSKWEPSSGAPSPVNINENTDVELVGKLNLGSNIREIFDDGRHGINNADWGLGSVKGYSQLPKDNFLVKAYTEVDLKGGQTYEFQAKGDDGYQIWLKNLNTNEWRWVTPKNQWQSTVGRKQDVDQFTHTIPTNKGGRYYVGFFQYENDQEAYFGLNWKEKGEIINSRIINAINFINPDVVKNGTQYYHRRDLTGNGKDDTMCNWFAAEVLHKLGIKDVPRHEGLFYPPHLNGKPKKKPRSADYLYKKYFTNNSKWESVNDVDAVKAVQSDEVVVASLPGNPGHIAIVRPDSEIDNILVAQAGWHTGKSLGINKAFGNHTPKYFKYVG